MLDKNHGHKSSYSTLLRRLKSYGLNRIQKAEEDDEGFLRTAHNRIEEIVNGPVSCGGYRTCWHTLEMEGIRVPRTFVQFALKEIDPYGCEQRKKHRLSRRVYKNDGPNYAWHIDGYDKLKPWGFPIHGAIDGFSRKVIWLNVTRSNNSPNNIASFYISTVQTYGGCPVELVNDLGTENGLAASMQCFFQNNTDAHRYVPSPRNQRIESWWSHFSKSRSSWWREYFSNLESHNIYDPTLDIHKAALWFCFSNILQSDLDFVKEHWNSHLIRKSRFDTISGRPDVIFELPENYGAADCLKSVQRNDIQTARQSIIRECETDDYQEYFRYVIDNYAVEMPENLEDAINLYKMLLDVSEECAHPAV